MKSQGAAQMGTNSSFSRNYIGVELQRKRNNNRYLMVADVIKQNKNIRDLYRSCPIAISCITQQPKCINSGCKDTILLFPIDF